MELLPEFAQFDSTWTCMECRREFQPGPDSGEWPHAAKTERDPRTGLNRIAGEICRECYERPSLPTPQDPTND